MLLHYEKLLNMNFQTQHERYQSSQLIDEFESQNLSVKDHNDTMLNYWKQQ